MRAKSTQLVVLALLGLVLPGGCGGSAAKGAGAAKPSAGDAAAKPGRKSDTGPKGEVGFLEASEPSCMLHEQAGAYFRCLSGSDGQCFHFGTTCTPKSRCMFQASSKQHRLCEESQNGSCLRYGKICEPEAGCMFSQADNRYRQCAKSKEGRCQSFGASCQPSS